MKLIIILNLLLNLNTKTDVIELTVTGSGITKDLAIQNALRNSLEQSFGSFISSKTEILNDVMIKDEVTSISTGNVVDFKVISHVKNQDLHSVVVKSKVSLSSFSNYIQSKGHNVVFDSESFSLKVKLQELNRKSEEKTVEDILVVFKNMVKKSIEFKVLIEEPLLVDPNTNKFLRNKPIFKSTGLNDIYTFDIKVVYGANKSLDEAYEYLINSLTSLSMSDFDVESYERINRPLYYLKLLKTDKKNNDFRNESGIIKFEWNYSNYDKVDYRSIYDINLDMSDRSENYKQIRYKQIKYEEIVLRSQLTCDQIVDALYEVNEYIYNFKLKFSNYEFTPRMYIKTSSLFDDLDYNKKWDGQTYRDYLDDNRVLLHIDSYDLYSYFKLSHLGLPGLNVYNPKDNSYSTSIYSSRFYNGSHKHRINQYTTEYTTRFDEVFHTNKELGVPGLNFFNCNYGHFYHNYSVYTDLQGLSNIGEIEVINLN